MRLGRIARDELAVVEHPAIHILRMRHVRVGRALQPAQPFVDVRRHAFAGQQHHRVVELRETVAAFGRVVELHQRRAIVAGVVVGDRRLRLVRRIGLRLRRTLRGHRDTYGPQAEQRADLPAYPDPTLRAPTARAVATVHDRTSCSACRVARNSQLTSADTVIIR